MPRRFGEKYPGGTDPFYLSPAWRKVKHAVMVRDGFQDVYIKRYGRMEPAEMVHHVFPLEEFPALRLNPHNLVSVSKETHNKLHTTGGSLTEAGRDLQRIILRRYPDLLPYVSGSPEDLRPAEASGEAGGVPGPRGSGA